MFQVNFLPVITIHYNFLDAPLGPDIFSLYKLVSFCGNTVKKKISNIDHRYDVEELFAISLLIRSFSGSTLGSTIFSLQNCQYFLEMYLNVKKYLFTYLMFSIYLCRIGVSKHLIISCKCRGQVS